MKIFRHLGALILFFTSLACLTACKHSCIKGSGTPKTDNRKVSDFKKISISGAYNVVLKQDSSYSLKITADDNLLPYIKTEVSDGRLHIFSKKNFCNKGEMTINIGVGRLEEIKSSGGVEVSNNGKLTVKDLRLKLSGAAKLNLDINADNVITEGSGAMELNLTGQAASHSIDMSGAGEVKAVNFVVGDCKIQSSGISHIEVNVLKTLAINSSGASDIKYKGNPSITQDKSGIGSIEKIN